MKAIVTIIMSLNLFGSIAQAAQPLPGIISDQKVDQIICKGNLEIRDHMARMGFIIRSLREMVNDIIDGQNSDELRAIIMVDVQVLRTHLTAVFPRTPVKIQNIDPDNLQSNKILFQRYLIRMLAYTLEIESELLKKPLDPLKEQAQRIRLADLIVKIDETVQEAHNLFRY